MKKTTLFLALALAGFATSTAHAQYLGSNSFTDITSLSQYSITTNAGTYAATGGVLEYTAGAAASSRAIYLNGNAANSAYTEDWTAKITLSNLAAPSSGYNLISLQVFSANAELGFFNIGLYRSATNTSGVLFEKARTTDGTVNTYNFTSYISAQSDFSDVLVVMSHNAATKDVTLGYSLDGGVTYHTDTMTFNPTSSSNGGAWYGAPNDGYSFRVLARNTADTSIGSGLMYADNFSVTAGMTAVPEPSTYAAIAGLGALGLAIWRRRQKAAPRA